MNNHQNPPNYYNFNLFPYREINTNYSGFDSFSSYHYNQFKEVYNDL